MEASVERLTPNFFCMEPFDVMALGPVCSFDHSHNHQVGGKFLVEKPFVAPTHTVIWLSMPDGPT